MYVGIPPLKARERDGSQRNHDWHPCVPRRGHPIPSKKTKVGISARIFERVLSWRLDLRDGRSHPISRVMQHLDLTDEEAAALITKRVRNGLGAGAKRIRTAGPPGEK